MENNINDYIYDNPHSKEWDRRYALYDIIYHQWDDQISNLIKHYPESLGAKYTLKKPNKERKQGVIQYNILIEPASNIIRNESCSPSRGRASEAPVRRGLFY